MGSRSRSLVNVDRRRRRRRLSEPFAFSINASAAAAFFGGTFPIESEPISSCGGRATTGIQSNPNPATERPNNLWLNHGTLAVSASSHRRNPKLRAERATEPMTPWALLPWFELWHAPRLPPLTNLTKRHITRHTTEPAMSAGGAGAAGGQGPSWLDVSRVCRRTRAIVEKCIACMRVCDVLCLLVMYVMPVAIMPQPLSLVRPHTTQNPTARQPAGHRGAAGVGGRAAGRGGRLLGRGRRAAPAGALPVREPVLFCPACLPVDWCRTHRVDPSWTAARPL